MTIENAISIYDKLSRPPKDALRQITGGKLRGKTDIKPQWRYRVMTETFGLVGIGWKYEVQKLWTEPGSGNEVMAFAQVAVYVKDGDNWSEPIIGIGGSSLVTTEKGSLVSNDEGYKMAVTDAFSTALKMIGVAADIYAGKWDGTKYHESHPQVQEQFKGGDATPEEKKELMNLFESKKADGMPVFTKEDKLDFSAMRKTKTAAEVIELVKNELAGRLQASMVSKVFDGQEIY